jgi:hypothetical protein
MKILLTTAGLLTAALLTACGGSAGHSDSYNKGSDWATANQTNGVNPSRVPGYRRRVSRIRNSAGTGAKPRRNGSKAAKMV